MWSRPRVYVDVPTIARELSIPMILDAALPEAGDGSSVTLDVERGVVYEEAVGREDISVPERGR